MKNNKPKLELEINIPQTITLLQDKPITGESQYGKWFLYNIESNGDEYSFFAPDKVVNFIEENHLGKGSEIEITKKIVKQGNKKITDFDIVIPSSNNVDTTPSTNGTNGIDSNNSEFQKMYQSMNEAIAIKEKLGSEVDASKIGITLFITRMKSVG